MPDFHLIFCDPVTKDNEVEIPFTLTGTDVSWRWFDCLYHTTQVNGVVADNNRWSGWETNRDTAQDICNRINDHLAVCRATHPKEFDITCSPDMSQDDFNKMHTYFEVYRGELLKPHPYFTNGTDEFRNALEQLNIDIHLFEQVDTKNKSARFNFPGGVLHRLEAKDNLLFEVNKIPNTLYLMFNMRGKNLMDFINDDDDHIGDENIRRYEWNGADFRLEISGWSEEQRLERMKLIDDVWHQHHDYLSSLGFHKGDPTNTVGWLPLATSDIDIAELVEPRQFLKGAKFW